MRIGNGEVDDNLDVWISQQFLNCTRFRDAVPICLADSTFQINISTSDDLQNIKKTRGLKINGADVATTDDADGGFVVHKRVTSFLLCGSRNQFHALL